MTTIETWGDGTRAHTTSDGQLHRDDGPALEGPGEHHSWWRHGQRHRDEGPAVHYAPDHLEWWRHDQRHRADGPALIHPHHPPRWYHHGHPLTPGDAVRAWAHPHRLDESDVRALIDLAHAHPATSLTVLHAALTGATTP